VCLLKFPSSSAVEPSAVNRLVVSSNLTSGAKLWRAGRVWLNASVLKTDEGLNPPGVRIPRSPPNIGGVAQLGEQLPCTQ
jgi:hypothetical protein